MSNATLSKKGSSGRCLIYVKLISKRTAMKNTLVLFSLIFLCANVSVAQKLGHSSLSPYAGSTDQGSHIIFQNVGETYTTQADLDDVILYEGLLNNISNDLFATFFIHVRYFFDENQNGVKDGDDYYLPMGAFAVGDEVFLNHEKQGVNLIAGEGMYTVDFVEIGTENLLLTNDASHTFELDAANSFRVVEFGLYVEQLQTELDINFISDPFRCGFPIEARMCVTNLGFLPESGTAWIDIDDRIDGIYFVQEPDHIIDDTHVGFDFDLAPQEKLTINYGLTVPLINTPDQLGEIYTTKGFTDTDLGRTAYCFEQELRCAYDPNDKLVNPNRPDSLGLMDQPITYTLRFQNTGNDYALNVEVRDTLSEYLNPNSFRLIDTSHPDELSVVFDPDDNYIVNFKFDNIYLPDSTTNEPGSNGFIMYQISALEGTPFNTEINNTGHIYFDFNPAIVTNTTSTTLVDSFPIINSVNDFEFEEEILVFPNPTKGLVQFDKEVDLVHVRDMYGRIVSTGLRTNKMDITSLPAATYFLEIYIEESKIIEKIILMD